LSFFLDPQEFSACIEDAHTIESIDPDNFRGTVKTGIGFIRGTFKWSATIKERVSPERAQFGIHGSGMGSAFDVVATLQVSEANGLSTVRWAADVQVSGTIATVGARLLKGTTEKKTNAFFENARKIFEKP
jgi:carbon monoxide dehydrogenase subunit G